MKDTLTTGLAGNEQFEVTPDMTPAHLAPMVVLSTPKMIELMEVVSLRTVQPHLDTGETSVGTLVNVTHEAAAGGGDLVDVTSEVTEVDRRLVTFSVVATVGEKVIGRGTHQRVVVDTSRFG